MTTISVFKICLPISRIALGLNIEVGIDFTSTLYLFAISTVLSFEVETTIKTSGLMVMIVMGLKLYLIVYQHYMLE